MLARKLQLTRGVELQPPEDDAPDGGAFWTAELPRRGLDAVRLFVASSVADLEPTPSTLGTARHIASCYEELVARGERYLAIELGRDTLVLEGPELTVYEDGDVLLRFAEGNAPVCDPYGIAVTFRNGEIVEMVNLEDAEEVD